MAHTAYRNGHGLFDGPGGAGRRRGETLPNLGSAPGSEFAEFIEVVGTATTVASGTTSTNTGYVVTAALSPQVGTVAAPCGATVSCAVYAVTGQVTDNGSGVDGANVIVSMTNGGGDGLNTAVNAYSAQSTLSVQTGSNGGYSLYVDVPETGATPS